MPDDLVGKAIGYPGGARFDNKGACICVILATTLNPTEEEKIMGKYMLNVSKFKNSHFCNALLRELLKNQVCGQSQYS